ncbi:unnamed protein product [Tetraodon nigroviridis]|nr:unnamed protein product [Tetraodon nigroviridis]
MTSGRRKALLSFLLLCLFSLTHTATGLQKSADRFALEGDEVTLPCGVPPAKACSSVSWSRLEEFGSVSAVASGGSVRPPYRLTFGLLKDCSLKINSLKLNDARTYWCHSNGINSSVSLHIVELIERSGPADGTVEFQCYLNTYQGHRQCLNRSIHIQWRTEQDALSTGTRIRIENPSECFSKLFISTKLTDHWRKWKCCVYQNEKLRASITRTTTLRDGIEEVFASVGESVSLSCHNTSSLGVSGSVEWAVGERVLSRGSLSLVIGKVSTLHAAEYRCSDPTDQQRVFNRVRLQTLEVRAESGKDDLALTCVLTCAGECESDSSLSWRGGGADGWQNTSVSVNGTLSNRLVLPVSTPADDLTCVVLSHGIVMASKKWHAVNTVWTSAWLLLPLALLAGLAAAGIYMLWRRRRDTEAGDAQLDLSLAHIYEVCQNENEAPTPPPEETASLYHLIQPI